jgi:hypothetical protein
MAQAGASRRVIRLNSLRLWQACDVLLLRIAMSNFLVRAARFSRLSLIASSTVAALFVFSSAACDSSLDAECCLAEPMCPDDMVEVDECQSDECETVSACCTEKLCEPIEDCMAIPTCAISEVEVTTCEGSQGFNCHEVTLCGTTIFCEEQPPCEAIPTCDEGDDELPSSVCPQDASCYMVELCGNMVFCLDNGLAHGCPEVPPVQGEPCPMEVTCEYPVEGDCVEIWSCGEPLPQPAPQPALQALEWQPGGTVCPEEEGS